MADQLSHLPPHDSNQELMAQGVANMVVPFFGGMPVTGTIARTVTNLRAGATSPVAGIVHAVALDTTGLDALNPVLEAVLARGGSLCVCNLNPQPRSLMERSGLGAKLTLS